MSIFIKFPQTIEKKIDEFFNNQDFIALKNEIIEKKDDINDSNKENKENKIVNTKLVY